MAGHVTVYPSKTAGWVGTQVHLVERKTLLPHPTSRFFYHPDSGWSRDHPQPGSLFQRPREAEKRDPGNEVGDFTGDLFSLRATKTYFGVPPEGSLSQTWRTLLVTRPQKRRKLQRKEENLVAFRRRILN